MTVVELDGPFANTADERRRAALTAASNATDLEDARVLLEMLGLRPYSSNAIGRKQQR